MADKAEKPKIRTLVSAMRKLEWLAAITRVHLRVGTILEPDKIARIYLREMIDMARCHGGAIIRIDGGTINILAEKGFSEKFGDMKHPADIPFVKEILNTKQHTSYGDAQSSPDMSPFLGASSTNSLICIPITVQNDVKGFIYLDSVTKNAFGDEDIEFAKILAAEISIHFEQSLEYTYSKNIIIRDGLTGCLNRTKFDLDIAAEIASAQEYEEELSLLLVDIDRLGEYNEFHGRPKGDKLIQEVAKILEANTRPYEKTYRYGQGRFAVLVTDTGKETASSIARRLLSIIEHTEFEGEAESQTSKKLTVSIGVATFPTDADGSVGLVECANAALHQAKESGRNQVHVFSE